MNRYTALASLAVATAVDFPTWDQVPRIVGNQNVVADLFDRGHVETITLGLFGDSQETAPGGAGNTYIPWLNYELWRHFGNVPETPLGYHISIGGAWLWFFGNGANSGGPDRIALADMPPRVIGRAMTDVPPQTYGGLYALRHDATGVAGIPTADYFRTDGDVVLEIIAATNASSGGVQWTTMPTDGVPSYFEPVEQSGGETAEQANLELAGPIEFRTITTPPLDFAGHEYMVAEIHGDDPAKLTDFVGVRWRNLTHDHGVVVDTFSAGGYTTRSITTNHANMGGLLSTLDHDAFVIHTGANDAYAALRTADVYRDDVLALIAMLRAAVGDPEKPIIIVTDVYREDGDPGPNAEFDQYAGAAADIAMNDPNVMAINARRIMADDFGWGPGNTSFLLDHVHLTEDGQRQLGISVIRELMRYTHPCAADITGDGVVDTSDLIALLAGYGLPGVTDINFDHTTDAGDLLDLLAAWGVYE